MRGQIVLIVLAVVFAVPVAMLLSFLGIPMPFAIAWILVGAAVLVVAQLGFADDLGVWPPPAPERVQRGSDVSRLAWGIDARTGVVGLAFRRRVLMLVQRRLREQGVAENASADEVDAILGPGVSAALAAEELHRADLERILHALEQLRVPPAQTSPPTQAVLSTPTVPPIQEAS